MRNGPSVGLGMKAAAEPVQCLARNLNLTEPEILRRVVGRVPAGTSWRVLSWAHIGSHLMLKLAEREKPGRWRETVGREDGGEQMREKWRSRKAEQEAERMRERKRYLFCKYTAPFLEPPGVGFPWFPFFALHEMSMNSHNNVT